MNPTFEVDNGALSLKPAILHKNMNILYVLCSVQIEFIGFIKTSEFAYRPGKKNLPGYSSSLVCTVCPFDQRVFACICIAI